MLSIFLIFFLLSPAVSLTGISRRFLHEPYILDSLPPSEPPSPSPPEPKYPFSTSTPNQSPFFPSYPTAPPPPPPSQVTFASFPANISSLAIPHSDEPKSASKLVSVTIIAVVSAFILVAIAVFFYCRRWHNSEYSDDKTSRSENSHRIATNRTQKLTTTTTSSEFLYLGTVVNSRGIGDRSDSRNNGESSVNDFDSRKLDSPELHPLPPLSGLSGLSGQIFRQNCGNADVNSRKEDEEEEFYSPTVSLGGHESSSGTESGSRRAFVGMAAANYVARSSESSSCSSSSSNSGSPARSHSISLSPPVSSSPRRLQPESMESVGFQAAPPPPPPPPPSFPPPPPPDHVMPRYSPSPDLSPARDFEKNPNLSNVRSPSLSPADLSPERALKKNADMSVRLWSVSDRNGQSSPESSPALSLPLGRITGASPRNVSDLSTISSSPDRDLMTFTVLWDRIKQSPLSPSPDREFEKISKVSDQSKQYSSNSSSPELKSSRTSNASDQDFQSPARIGNALPHPLQVLSVPPPPPPLPPPKRHWKTPIPSMPLARSVSEPPPLIPPSRPFVSQKNPTMVSPIQLPPCSVTTENIEETSKPKLKPLHWDKVRASSDREMVWDHLRSSSFKLNEEMIETLFIVNKPKETTPRAVLPSPNQENRVLDPKKSQNIAISLRALNVSIEEVCEALLEGNVDTLGAELLESLLKMAPTKEEERKLQEYKDDSPFKLGPAEKFLKALLDVPFAFRKLDAMLYIANFESEIEYLKTSFHTLEAACEELRNSRMFLKLLQAVLKTGNRMNVGTNRGDAHAFKLDTLLKLVDVKGADGKTTLLHFVVQEIIRTEGARAAINEDDAKCRNLGLQVVSGLSSELTNVKKAAAMDSDILSSDVSKLSRGIGNIMEVVRLHQTLGARDISQKFSESMTRFIKMGEEKIIRIQAQESVAFSLVKEITEYFHGNSAKEEAHPFRIFMVVRDFLTILDRVCKEVSTINDRTTISSNHRFPVPVNPMLLPVFPDDQGTSP